MHGLPRQAVEHPEQKPLHHGTLQCVFRALHTTAWRQVNKQPTHQVEPRPRERTSILDMRTRCMIGSSRSRCGASQAPDGPSASFSAPCGRTGRPSGPRGNAAMPVACSPAPAVAALVEPLLSTPEAVSALPLAVGGGTEAAAAWSAGHQSLCDADAEANGQM